MSDPVSTLAPPVVATTPWRDPGEVAPPDSGEMQFRELWADKEKGFGFADLIDIVNPLQHLPVIGTLYRAITGDQISFGARLVGSALFGGPMGVIGAAALAASEQATGAEPGQHVIAALKDLFGGGSGRDTTQFATGDDAAKADAARLAGIAPAAGAPAAVPVPADAAVIAAIAMPVLSPATRGAAAIAPTATGDPAGERPEFPAFPRAPTPLVRGVPLAVRPALSPVRREPPPATPPANGDATPSDAPHAAARPDGRQMDAESRRILASVEEARRAQAALLLASVQGGAALPSSASPARDGNADESDGTSRDRAAAADPFRNHPLLPPPGAPPAWIGHAMGRALDRYQQTQRLPLGTAPNPIVPATAP